MTAEATNPGAIGPGRGGRMSRRRKTAAVVRLLRGEDLETVSRALGVTAATLSAWRDAFLTAGERQALRSGRGLPSLGPRPLDRLPGSGAAASGHPAAAPGARRADAGR